MRLPGSSSPRRPWRDRRIVLGVTGGIAAYKSVQLARDLTLLGSQVTVVLTEAATRFAAPLSFEAVTGRPALQDLFSAEGAALHIRLAREADLILVAPATADFMARAAHGRADDLLTTLLLAAGGPVILAPAMNDAMLRHPQTQRNVQHLEQVLSYRIAGPATGPLAYGEGEGPGRMLDPETLIQHAGRALAESPPFLGRTVLVTSGPTREPLDPVRYLGNRSSGRMGHAVAGAAWRRGARVLLVSGPAAVPSPSGVELIPVETASEMDEAVRARAGEAHLLVFAAAVADFRPEVSQESKVKRKQHDEGLNLKFHPNPDVALASRGARRADAVVVGFALETEDLVEEARRKLTEKGFDLVVANRVERGQSGFEVETNQVTVLDSEGAVEELPLLPKDEVAEQILDRAGRLGEERWGEEG